MQPMRSFSSQYCTRRESVCCWVVVPDQKTSLLRKARFLKGQSISGVLRARHIVVDHLAVRASFDTYLRAPRQARPNLLVAHQSSKMPPKKKKKTAARATPKPSKSNETKNNKVSTLLTDVASRAQY